MRLLRRTRRCSICIANFPSMTIRPGSMGKPVPGVEATVVDENGEPLPILTMGELALRPGWPSMMTAIWEDEERYRNYFRVENLFLTGDMVTKDEDGYYYHQGRNDDLIKVGFPSPVIIVSDHGQVVAVDPFHELKGTRSNGSS